MVEKITPHSYPKTQQPGNRICLVCNLKESQEFKYPNCEDPGEIWDLNDRLALPKTVKGSGKKNGKVEHTQKPLFPTIKEVKPLCYEKHPSLPIGAFRAYGGSAQYPMIEDADIYLGLDSSMACGPKEMPWTPGFAFRFLIPDMKAPPSPEYFMELIDWLVDAMLVGKKIHVGCIGGHGRTGTVLSAMAARCQIPDAIAYVRANYCDKAVETASQIEFLGTYFGCPPVKPSKVYGGPVKRHFPDPTYPGSDSDPDVTE